MAYRRRKDRDNDWYVFIELSQFGREGRVVRRSPVQSAQGAKRFEHELLEEMITGEFFQEPKPDVPTLAEWAQEWLNVVIRADPDKSENTAITYKSYLNNHILPFFGPDTHLDEITTGQIKRWRAKKSAKYASNTIRSMAVCLSSLLSEAEEWDLIDEAPSVGSFALGQQDRPEWMDQDSCKVLIESIEDHQARAMVMTCWQTGVRKMTMAGLKWSDVDWDRRSLHVQRKLSRDASEEQDLKSHSDRVIPLTDKALSAFESVRDLNEGLSPYIFFDHKHERAWDANRLRDLIQDVWPASLDKGPGWHILRHSFASQLVKNGVSLKKVSVLLGHKSVTTTEKYAHLKPNELHADLEALMA